MKNSGLRSLYGGLSAAILAVAGMLLSLLCVRSALVRALPSAAPSVAWLAPHNPDVVLTRAISDLVERHGVLDAGTLDAVRRAAARAPLDARPFLILGHQQILDGRSRRGVATLEAGRRLDPRQRLIHLLLLDRYLRASRYTDASIELSVLSRLVGQAQGPIAAAVAAMSGMPETRDAVRVTLRSDPTLERLVLITLAKSDTAPGTIFALASPIARWDARELDSWGPVLISRLVEKGQFNEARSVWQHIYALSAAQVAAPLYDARFQTLAGSPPFNWTFAASGLGAADVRSGALAVEYYGRESGELASQLLVLHPRSYRFSFSAEGGTTKDGAMVYWSLSCATGNKAELLRIPVAGSATKHSISASFAVPRDCPAQHLSLAGEAGEFPVPINVTLRDLDIRVVPGTAT